MFTLWWQRDGRSTPPTDQDLTAPLDLADAAVYVEGDDRCRIAWSPWTGPHRVGTAYDPASGVRLVCWARLDNVNDIGAALGRSHSPHREAHPAQWLLAAYLRWGVDAPRHLRGDYSVAVVDPNRDELVTWRDAIGVRPLFFTESPGFVAASTTVSGLTTLEGVDSTINPQWLVLRGLALTTFHSSTPYISVRSVEPGHWLRVGRETVHQSRYFTFDPESPWSDHLDEGWVEDMRQKMDRAVLDRLPLSGPVGSEATAGLDSSGVIASIAAVDGGGARLHTFSQTTFSDPPDLIRATSQRWGAQCTIDPEWREGEFAASPHRVSAAAGYRHSHGMADLMVPAYRNCKEQGINTLFSGFGGDQCVSNDAAKAILEWTDRGEWLGAATHVVAPGWKAPVRAWRLRRQVESGSPSMTLTELSLSTGFRPEVLIDTQALDLWHEYERPLHERSVNGAIVDGEGVPLSRRSGYWSRRAEECSVAAALFGVEYVWPLLDTVLMQQFLSTPTAEKYFQAKSRFLYRRVISPRVPPQVAWRPVKVPGGPPPETQEQRTTNWEPPLRFESLHPLLQELIDPDVLSCGLTSSPAGISRVAQRRIHQTNRWLQDHTG